MFCSVALRPIQQFRVKAWLVRLSLSEFGRVRLYGLFFAARTRMVSVAEFALNYWNFARNFKGLFFEMTFASSSPPRLCGTSGACSKLHDISAGWRSCA